MKSQGPKPSLFAKRGGELSLSSPALVELLRAVLDKGKPFRFRTKGYSMFPFIKDGDIITLSPLTSRLPRLGEVVAYLSKEAGRLIVHRVIGKRGEAYLISGDSAQKMQDWVAEADILGRVARVERNGRDVRLGLGPERCLIALLNRCRPTREMLVLVWRLLPPFRTRRDGLVRAESS